MIILIEYNLHKPCFSIIRAPDSPQLPRIIGALLYLVMSVSSILFSLFLICAYFVIGTWAVKSERKYLKNWTELGYCFHWQNCHSFMDTVGICVRTGQIREFPTFNASSALRHSPSARCAIAANDVCIFLDTFRQKHCFLWGHSLHGKVSRLIVLV
jgi:hypothetical protein